MTRSLIVGVDDSDGSRHALARAAELARAAGLRLVAVHVRHIPVCALTERAGFDLVRHTQVRVR
jgi:nucleotide-binding universal stress UspA family protein